MYVTHLQHVHVTVDGLEQWMTGMGGTLNQQDLIAARVNLVEGQIEGFKVHSTYSFCVHVA